MSMDLTIESLGGMCPVQGEGRIDGQYFYFRARGSCWGLEVWPPGIAPEASGELPTSDCEWYYGRQWSACRTGEIDAEFGAGYMPIKIAEKFIREAGELWAKWAAEGKP